MPPVTLDAPTSGQGNYPHGYSGKTTQIVFTKPFIFTHPDHIRETFPARACEVPEEIATHWFALAHTDTPMPFIPSPGSPAYAEARRAEQAIATNRLFDQQQLDMASAAAVNRKAIEETVRAEATEKIRAEVMIAMKADFDKKLAEAVAETTAALSTSNDVKTAADDGGNKNGKGK